MASSDPPKELFSEPKFVISKVYTKKGDSGCTRLVGGQEVEKNDPRIAAFGTVDELNAFVGVACVDIASELQDTEDRARLLATLTRIQHELFNLGSILATMPEDVHPKQPQIRLENIGQLETDMDACNERMPPLRSFVLPGGCRANADLHVCRTVCRRAERALVELMQVDSDVPNEALMYLNRLSDAFFVWSRWVCRLANVEEVLWQPNKPAEMAS